MAQAPPAGDMTAFIEHSRRFGGDYEPSPGPADLSSRADVVVVGQIVGVRAGQEYAPGPDAPPAISTSVIDVRVERVLKGDSNLVHRDHVYFEVPHPAFVSENEDAQPAPYDREGYAATVPHARGVFFLGDRTHEPYWDTVLDKGAGRPAGAPITAPLTQGFLINDPDGRLLSVFENFASMPPAWRELRSIGDVEEDLE